MNVGGVWIGGGGGVGRLGFDGGTLKATRNEWWFISGLNSATINSGGAKIDNGGYNIGINQSLDGSGGLNLYGSGWTTLRQNNTFSGNTVVNAGVLGFNDSGSLYNNGTSSGNITVNSGASLYFNRGNTFGNADTGSSSPVSITLNGGTINNGGVFNNLATLTMNGGTLNASGGQDSSWNAYELNNVTVGGGSASSITANTSINTDNAILLSRAGTTTFNVGVTGDARGDLLVSANLIDGNGVVGSLTKTGLGTMVLSGTNTYSGGTTVNAGTLKAAAGWTIGGNVTINSGGTVLASGADNTLWGVSSNTINSGGTLTGAGGNSTHLKSVILNGGTISSTGTVSGSGSDYGTFDFDNGVTTIGSSNTSVISAQNVSLTQSGGTIFNVASGATNGIDLLVSGTIGEPSLIAPYTSALVKQGNGVMVLSGNNSYTNTTTISAGTLQVGNGGTSGTLGSGSVANNSSLVFNRSDNYGGSISNAISGSGSLTVMGGSLTLSASNSYLGLTRVQGGKLSVNGSIAGALQVDSGATLGGSGTIGGNAVIYGTHSPGNSPGLQSFSSGLTYKSSSTALLEFTQNATTGRGTSFDGINVAGNLGIESGAAVNLLFSGAGSAILWSDAFWKSNQSWLLYQVNGTTTGSFSLTSTNWQDASGNFFNTSLNGSAFSIAQNGQNLMLTYAVPEPSTYALMGLGVLALMFAYRRRRA